MLVVVRKNVQWFLLFGFLIMTKSPRYPTIRELKKFGIEIGVIVILLNILPRHVQHVFGFEWLDDITVSA